MPATRSEEYYFPREDLVIQVEDTLYRLHRGSLELHSGFFRDMFSTPSSEDQEGTSEECPLRLPETLCSAESFTTLCKLICPKVMGISPPVLVKDFAQWEAVLEATEALQMTGVQNYILTRLQDDQADIKTKPIRLLSWAMRSELPLETLKLECFYALAYRCRPLSEAEMHVLGYKASAQVMRVRERIRGLFLSNSASAELLLAHIHIQPPCGRQECRNIIFKHIIQNLTKDSPMCDSEQEQDNSSIFQIPLDNVSGLCYSYRCASQAALDETGPALKKVKLDEEVRRCVFGVGPPSVGP